MEENHKTNTYTYFSIFVVSILGLTLGASMTWSSPVLFKLQHTNGTENPMGHAISDDQVTWIGSFGTLGGALGPIPTGYMAAKVGRKPVMLAVGLFFLGSSTLLGFAKVVYLYYLGRFISGIAVGGAFTIIPSYVSEIAHHKDRAKLNGAGVIMMCLGVWMSYILGPYMPIMYFNLLAAVIALVFVGSFAIYGVESPHSLISRGRQEHAQLVLSKLRKATPEVIEKERVEIQNYIESHSQGTLRDLFKSRTLVKCLLISLVLTTTQQTSGVTPLIMYTQQIFEAAGTSVSSDVAAIIFSGVQFFTSFGPMFIYPRFKFRTLLIFSYISCVIFLTSLGLYFYLSEKTTTNMGPLGWLPIASMIGIVVSFQYGFGGIPAILISEMFPTNLRSLVISINTTLGSLLGFVVSKYYMSMTVALGTDVCFWMFASTLAAAIFFVVVFVPETNGKTFNEIQNIIRGRK